MNDTVTTVALVAGTLVAILTLVMQARKWAREQAASEQAERAEIAGTAFANGAKSRDAEVALLRSQRDDARQDRDQYRRERDEAQREVRDLQRRDR